MNTTYVVLGLLVIVVLAAVAYYAAVPAHQAKQASAGVSGEKLNQGEHSETNIPESVAPEENLPNPEDTIIVDENTVDMLLPEDI